MVHRLRQGLQEEGTAANSASAAVAGARAALADETLPATLRQCVARQLTHLRELDARTHRLSQDARGDRQQTRPTGVDAVNKRRALARTCCGKLKHRPYSVVRPRRDDARARYLLV